MKGILKLVLALALLILAPLSQSALIRYAADLNGPAEAPPNASPGTGFASVDYDSTAHTLFIAASWLGLIGTTTVAHIHCCTDVPNSGAVGVAVTPGTLPGFPAGTTAGSYSVLLDLTDAATFTTAFVSTFAGNVVADAEEALIAGFDAQRAYFNIHSTEFPGGEIRGFLATPQPVPEPGTLGLFGLSLAALALRRLKKA